VVSAQVAALTDGLLKAMLLARLKVMALVLLLIGGAVMGGALAHRSIADTRADPPSAAAEPLPTLPLEASPETEKEAGPSRGPRRGETILAGTLQGVDVGRNTITVAISNRQTGKAEKTLELAGAVEVLRDGKPARFGDLKPGGRITVKVSLDQKTALRISETGKTMAAPLKAVDPANRTITITVSGGRDPTQKDVTHSLAKDGKVTLEGKEAQLADLKPGSTVQLTFSVDDEKTLVHIQYASQNR
jgi:hypothetical protein